MSRRAAPVRPTPVRRALQALWADASAATAVEFALVVPFFLIIVFGAISTALTLSAVSQMHYAAERSARCLAVNVTTPCTKAAIDTYAKGWYKGPGLTGLTFTSPNTDPSCGKQVNASATYAIIAGIQRTAVSLSATACYPII
jgi:Flp pilus assembly pilin Flp